MIEDLEKYKKECKVMDIEADGLLEDLTKMHVASIAYHNKDTDKYKIYSTEYLNTALTMIEESNGPVVGHNFYLYDVPALEKLRGKELPLDNIIDSLFVSWYIEPNRSRHGLEAHGEDLGVKKVEIGDWNNLSQEAYKLRCETDVKINTALWHKQLNKLFTLYEGDIEKVKSLLTFLMIKARVYKMQQDNPLRLDVKGVEESLALLESMEGKILETLKQVMPKAKKKMKRSRPKSLYKKDGSLSTAGERWQDLIESLGYRLGEEPEQLEYYVESGEANPGSVSQIKDWLFSLGWEPGYYKESVNVEGEVNKVPQVKKGDNLCESVKLLAEKEPSILVYEDLGVIQHRIGILKGFLRDVDENGNITARIAGLTNTLRIRHKELVNLPGVHAAYGEHIRPKLLPPEGHVIIGADLSSLENTTRNHYVYPLDKDFVEAQNVPMYDPHLDLALKAGMATEEQVKSYKLQKAGEIEMTPEFEELNQLRSRAKTVTYSALYGVGKNKLAKEIGVKPAEAKKFLDAYWDIHWSVKKFASSCRVRTIDDQMWVKNPLNGYWYSLRYEKDIFSTINQGTGDFIFTMWEYFLIQEGVTIRGGFHDEVIITCPEDQVEETVAKLYKAIDKVNQVLPLNVPVSIDHKVGKNYGEVH